MAEYKEVTENQNFILLIDKNADKETNSICTEYWEFYFNEYNQIKYNHTVADIAKKYNKKPLDITNITKANSFILDTYCTCNTCGAFLSQSKIYTRANMPTYLKSEENYNFICTDCHEEQERIQAEKQEKEQIEKFLNELDEHKKAIETSVYESLNSLELNYLVKLAIIGDSVKVSKFLGISEKRRIELHEKMIDLKLIVPHYKGGYSIDEDFKHALQNIDINSKIKPIFGSKAAHALYQKLKKKYLYVYPEIPLAAFIQKQDIEHLFTERWHSDYFLMCRLDFVVTDQNGLPKFGVEYQGGYHQNPEQKIKDEFKRQIMNESGLEIQYMNYSDIKDKQ